VVVILTVTLNPAWDVTYPVGKLVPGTTHRVAQPHGRAGGKGINVSRVLHHMGRPSRATGVLLGDNGRAIASELAATGIDAAFIDAGDAASSRSTVTLLEADGQATVLNEPGPREGSFDWDHALNELGALISTCRVLVLSGSLPPAVPGDAYARLIHLAHRYGCTVILDADGEALVAALQARPDLVKPNVDELAAATGTTDIAEGIDILLKAGARSVVVSAGPDGMVGATPQGSWQAAPPLLQAVNPTGAGDAAVAGLAAGLLAGEALPELLRIATAWSAASVLEPVAGDISAALADEMRAAITCQPAAQSTHASSASFTPPTLKGASL
jgi:tagatose 6-phosphate kinase